MKNIRPSRVVQEYIGYLIGRVESSIRQWNERARRCNKGKFGGPPAREVWCGQSGGRRRGLSGGAWNECVRRRRAKPRKQRANAGRDEAEADGGAGGRVRTQEGEALKGARRVKTRWAWSAGRGSALAGVQKGVAAMVRTATEHSHREMKRWERARCRRDDAGGAWRCRPALAAVCKCAIFSARRPTAEGRRLAAQRQQQQ